MSAAYWRRAMQNGGGTGAASTRPSITGGVPRNASRNIGDRRMATPWPWLAPRYVIVMIFLLIYPFIATPFFTFQIGAQTLVLGTIALSLTFLGGYGGMVSLSQMSIAGITGYMVAICGTSGTMSISMGWPWWLAVADALLVAVIAATLIGWLSVRTEGIYTIMITLAVGVAFFYFAQQNYSVFAGFRGFQKVMPPDLFGVQWREPLPFYFLCLFWALVCYTFIQYLVRTPFGIALQGIRDNARRMNALGFNVTAHRVAAHSLAGLIAGIGGVLSVWYNGMISPGSVNSGAMINILVIAVLGGMRRSIGAYIGALIFVLLQNFAIDVFDRERFNLVIGAVFLLIVLFSPDGVLGLWARLRTRLSADRGMK